MMELGQPPICAGAARRAPSWSCQEKTSFLRDGLRGPAMSCGQSPSIHNDSLTPELGQSPRCLQHSFPPSSPLVLPSTVSDRRRLIAGPEHLRTLWLGSAHIPIDIRRN